MEQHTQTTETTTTEKTTNGAPSAAVNGLAIVGFIALIILGIVLAIYAVRYIPAAISQLSQNASTTPALTTVPTPTGNSLPFSEQEVATTTTIGPVQTPPTTGVSETMPNGNTESAPRLYGLPDLSVQIISTGYLANGSNSSFVPARVIPAGARAAVQFTITNLGTNATGPWNFITELPAANNYIFNSPIEQNLNPGDHILFTLGFDQANPQPGPQVVTVVADPNNQINESNEGNNSQSAAFQIGY